MNQTDGARRYYAPDGSSEILMLGGEPELLGVKPAMTETKPDGTVIYWYVPSHLSGGAVKEEKE